MTFTYSLKFTFHHSFKGKLCFSKTINVLLLHMYN